MSGVIEPKSEIQIKFKFMVKLYGKFEFYFKCNVEALDLPIGFELTANVFGLDISYELPLKVQEMSLMRKKMLKKMKRQGSMSIDMNSSLASSSRNKVKIIIQPLINLFRPRKK